MGNPECIFKCGGDCAYAREMARDTQWHGENLNESMWDAVEGSSQLYKDADGLGAAGCVNDRDVAEEHDIQDKA